MEFHAVHSLYASFGDDLLSIIYSGSFPDDLSARLIQLAEEAVGDEDGRRTERTRLAFIMVEAYQNIIRHRAPLPEALAKGDGRSMFMLRSGSQLHTVTAIDPVRIRETGKLRELLAAVEGKDRAQLKEMFLGALEHGRISERGGAGLGIIEMARRSGNRLLHSMQPIDPDHARFTLVAALGDLPAGAAGGLLDTSAAMHAEVARRDVRLFFRGRPLPAALELLLRIAQRDMQDAPDRSMSCARAVLAAGEVLTACDPDAVHKGIVILHGQDDGLAITFGTVLSPGLASKLESEVDGMKREEPPALQKSYRRLLTSAKEPEAHALLGLLDLARHPGAALSAHRTVSDGEGLMLFSARI